MDDGRRTGDTGGVLAILVNDLGAIAFAARTLLERWVQLPDHQRDSLLTEIDQAVVRGIGRLDALATADAP